MKLLYKIFGVILLIFAIALTSLALVLSHDSACEPAPLLSGDSSVMKAIVYRCYGSADVLEFEDIEKPEPAADEVLVKVHAASVNPLDWHYMRGSPYIMRLGSGLGSPDESQLGVDFAGTVEAVGKNVSRFKPGDEVFGGRTGAFAEFLTVREDRALALKPDNVTFEQAASVPIAALTALQALRDKGQIKAGQKVLINGASGGVGTFAVQIAKSFGAEVTGVCSTRNLEMVRSIGADHVIDYTREDYTQSGQRYDLIVDNVGNRSLLENRDVLTPDGNFVIVGGPGGNWLGPLIRPINAMLLSPFVSQNFVMLMAAMNQEDLAVLSDLMQAGKVKPVIDRHYTLEQVPEAIRYSEEGHARGKIVIKLGGIQTDNLSATVKVLASDEFEGRAPGGAGEEKTIAYLIERFESLGLEPGAADGAWTQAVPLNHTQVQNPVSLSLVAGDTDIALEQTRDIEISTIRPLEQIKVENAPVVFVGFGANAPERDWDDFGDIDLSGKVALFLVNDPDFAAGPDEAVAGRFGNKRMTYYGRWTYKFEEAGRRGAVAALVIHEDKAAGYGWNVASSSPGENYSIVRSEGSAEPVMLQGWLHQDAAVRLFQSIGMDLDEQRRLARSPEFQAFELGDVTFSADLAVSVERIESQNVLALLPGAIRPEETIMVSAHWDAYGLGEPDAEGRRVRPGANDDALGIAGVLELARVLKAEAPFERSLVFAAWTAEESGLLGSEAYATNPVYPLEKTVANLTLDIMQTAGPARDVILVGEGQSDLEDDLERAAKQQKRVVTPENLPENGLFFRADHFSLARRGVPVLLIMGIAGGSDLIEGGRTAGDQWIADYIANCYHQTCDAWSPDWDLRGAAQDIELFHMIVNDLGNSRRWPEWKPGSEFKSIRKETAQLRN